jgi:hypothetical protein
LATCTPEGILKTTKSGALTISNEVSCLLRSHRIAIFFNDSWIPGLVAKDEHGWYLEDDNGNEVGLRPGIRVRLIL